MNELEEHIKRVNNKIQQVLKQYQQLQKDNVRLAREVEVIKEQKEDQHTNIQQLQQQVAILKSAAGQMTAADKKDFEKNISKYIREIEKCIGLLSE